MVYTATDRPEYCNNHIRPALKEKKKDVARLKFVFFFQKTK